MINTFPQVYRTNVIKGTSIPGIIKNGSYFFTDLDVYENGRVSCWNFKDFEHFKKDVARNWVVTSIPNGKNISIHGLGEWKIDNGQWDFTKDNFCDYVFSIVKTLNPKLENLYTYSEKKINGISVGEMGTGKVYKEKPRHENDMFPPKIDGEKMNLFYQEKKEEAHLISLSIYSKKSIVINRFSKKIELSLLELEDWIHKKRIKSSIEAGCKVYIHGLGNFDILNCSYDNNIEDKLAEIKDHIRTLKGEPSLVEIGRIAFDEYLKNPTKKGKEALKVAYENIPDHQKMFIGDMDTKDIEVRMIIYGKDEIENWSHYQVAKSQGSKLPSINIPKENEEE